MAIISATLSVTYAQINGAVTHALNSALYYY